MEILGTGQSANLMIAVGKAGTVKVSIDKADVDPDPRTVTVYMGYEIPSPEKTGITILSPPDTTFYGRNMEFSTAGLVLGWLYSDGSVETIPAGEGGGGVRRLASCLASGLHGRVNSERRYYE
ncbi:MAG: hypothetical protein LBF83_09505 [Spirochaetaceae bacterium]|jgi:hypothetical protein|nr:hypothetical protein [Spirochaetaceae bacterium]